MKRPNILAEGPQGWAPGRPSARR